MTVSVSASPCRRAWREAHPTGWLWAGGSVGKTTTKEMLRRGIPEPPADDTCLLPRNHNNLLLVCHSYGAFLLQKTPKVAVASWA